MQLLNISKQGWNAAFSLNRWEEFLVVENLWFSDVLKGVLKEASGMKWVNRPRILIFVLSNSLNLAKYCDEKTNMKI